VCSALQRAMVEGGWVDKGAAVRPCGGAEKHWYRLPVSSRVPGGAGTASLRATSSTRREQAEGRAEAGDVRLLSTALAKKKKKREERDRTNLISDIFDLG